MNEDNPDPTIKAMLEMFLGPDTRGGRALFLNGAFLVDDAFNRREVHAAEIPAANGIGNGGGVGQGLRRDDGRRSTACSC